MNDYIFNNLYLTKLYVFFYKKNINKRLNKFFTFAFQNEYHLLLNELIILYSMDYEIQLMKNIKRLLKNNKYQLIEKILFNQVEMDNFHRTIIYNVISDEIEPNILKNNIIFFDFIFNNKILKENHIIVSELVENSFYLEDIILFERSINYFINNYATLEPEVTADDIYISSSLHDLIPTAFTTASPTYASYADQFQDYL